MVLCLLGRRPRWHRANRTRSRRSEPPSPKLGTFTLTSVTGYSVSRLYDELDFSQILGARSSQWTPDLYVNNVMNRRGSVGGGIGTAIPTTFSVIQPRTIGVSVARTF